MEAALVEGCEFSQNQLGFWYPNIERRTGKANAKKTQNVLRAVAHALDFRSIDAYIGASENPEEIQKRLNALIIPEE